MITLVKKMMIKLVVMAAAWFHSSVHVHQTQEKDRLGWKQSPRVLWTPI